MEEKKRKRANIKITISILVACIIILIIGISTAYFIFVTREEVQRADVELFTYGELITRGDNLTMNGEIGESSTKEFSIYNSSDTTFSYTLTFAVEENELISTGNGQDITIDVIPTTNISSLTDAGLTTISGKKLIMPRETTDNTVIANATIAPGDTHVYNATIAYNDTGGVQNINMGKKFNGYFKLIDVKQTERSNPNAIIRPKLVQNLIPVIYDEENSTWVKSSPYNSDWFDYDNQKWANAVTVSETIRNDIIMAPAGTPIDINNILGMYVWIPRYEYRIEGTYGTGGTSLSSPGEILIKFIKKSQIEADSGYKVHPVFTDGSKNNYKFGGWDSEIDGFWYGKFETSGENTSPMIIPNVSSKRAIIGIDMFKMARRVSDFQMIDLDSHMSKNDEWGAVAYLSQSKYGKYGNSMYTGANKEIYINNNTNFITGLSAGVPSASENSEIVYRYDDIENRGGGLGAGGTGASTTGNIYGIYDMNGGAWEPVAGNYGLIVANSGVPDDCTLPTSSYYIAPKYANIYTSTTLNAACGGDPCYGHALSETSVGNTELKSWYNDFRNNVAYDTPWFERGGRITNGTGAGIFAFNSTGGYASDFRSFRVALT